MTCEEVINKCLLVERYKRLPFNVMFHLLHCKRCRKNVCNIMRATHFYYPKMMVPAKQTNLLYVKTMKSILDADYITNNSGVFRKESCFSFFVFVLWCIIGMFSLFTYVFLPSTNMGSPFVATFNTCFRLQFFLIIAFFFTIYTIIFIARNIEFLTNVLKFVKVNGD